LHRAKALDEQIMKILHTADWHLGKRLHKADIAQDHALFFDWLLAKIKEEQIELLLIAGDVFDLSYPSSEAEQMYFNVLVKITQLNCRIIITGGNHDSPSVLNAPRQVLKEINVDVVGGLPKDLKDLIIPVVSRDGKEQVVIAAIPFLRDADLRSMLPGETYEQKLEAIRQGIAIIFNSAADICMHAHAGIPAVAMGHLFAAGASTSDSEREIQIGNLAGFDAGMFSDYFSYVALGHIHKPQRAGNSGKVLYSGSPVSLSFGERKDEKRVMILEVKGGKVTHESIEIPKFRMLAKITGTLAEVKEKADALKDVAQQLKTLIEIEMIEANDDPRRVLELENYVQEFSSEHCEIVKVRYNPKERIASATDLFGEKKGIEEFKPIDVLEKKMIATQLSEADRSTLRIAFYEILDEIGQNSDKQ
jgi:exonuclease SbcD